MILNSLDNFICLEFSNPAENIIINNITRWIFEQKKSSVTTCGAETNVSFASDLPYLAFLLTVEKGTDFNDVQTDTSGKVIDSRLQSLYIYIQTDHFLNSISSYCLLKDGPSSLYIEIWDVCIFLEKRGQGVGNLLIKNAVRLYPLNFWLGVIADNIAAATLYIKNGFAIEKITNPFPNLLLITMVFDQHSPSSNVDYNIQLFKRLSDRILGFVKTEHLNIKIESEVINFIDTLVKNQSIDYEVGGCLMTKHTDKFNLNIETKNGKSFIVLEMNKFLMKGSSNNIGEITTEYNFMFITQPISLFNLNGLVVQMPFIDITFCVKSMLYNISKLIKTQKFFIFSFDGVISISISSILTEFILTCLDKSLEFNIHTEIFEGLELCFARLTRLKMLENYQESLTTNNQIILQNSGQPHNVIRQQTGFATCSIINKVSIKDFADTDHDKTVISHMLSIFFNDKGLDISSLPVFKAEYHEISDSARSEGLYICEETIVPRNLADLKYSVTDIAKLDSTNVLTRLSVVPEYTPFVLE